MVETVDFGKDRGSYLMALVEDARRWPEAGGRRHGKTLCANVVVEFARRAEMQRALQGV